MPTTLEEELGLLCAVFAVQLVLSVLGPGRAAHLPSVVLQPSIFPVPGDGGGVKEREREASDDDDDDDGDRLHRRCENGRVSGRESERVESRRERKTPLSDCLLLDLASVPPSLPHWIQGKH